MANFFIFSTSKKVRGPEVEMSANRTGTGRGKGPKSKSDCPDLRGLLLEHNKRLHLDSHSLHIGRTQLLLPPTKDTKIISWL